MLKPYKERKIDFSKKVSIYRNLNRKGFIFSIKQNGLVVAYGNKFSIINPTFKINKKGRERTIVSNVRNVHAFIIGHIFIGTFNNETNLKYNPFKSEYFYDGENIIYKADYISFNENKVCYV